MVPSETVNKYMIEKDFPKLKDALFENADEYLRIRNLETPCYTTDRDLSPNARVIVIHAAAFPVECGWSAEALRSIFLRFEKTKNIKRAFKELVKAGYAEEVYSGDKNGKFARYAVSEESRIPEKRRFITSKVVWANTDPEAWEEAIAMAGRELAQDEVLVVFKTAYGALPGKNAYRIAKWDADATVYKECDAELAARTDVCVAEIIYLSKN